MELTIKKRLAGFAAAGVLALAMAPMAAFGAGALQKDGSISVTGLIDASDTAQCYQIVTQDPTTNAWKLSANVDSDSDGKIDGSEITINNLVIQDPNATGDATKVINSDMANAIAAAITANNASGQAMDKEGTTASKAGVDAGLYMVVATPGANNKNTVYKPIFVSADYSSTDGTNTYALVKNASDYADNKPIFKASDLTINKTAEEINNAVGDTKSEGVGVGDTLKFTVTTPIVGYTKDYTNPVFKITDALTEGLSLKTGTIQVTVAGFTEGTNINKGTDYTVTENGTSGYVVAFDKKFLWAVKSNQQVTITYEATVTSTAGAQVNQMDNTVKLNFSNAPTDTTGAGTLTDKTRHYTFDIDGDVLGGSESTGGDPNKKRTEEIQKVYIESNGTATPSMPATSYNGTNALEGAEFQLTDQTTGKIVEWTNKVRSGSADAPNNKTKIVSDDYGSIVMKGLDEGTYKLKETKAPQGYTPDPTEHIIVIAAEYVNDADGNKILKEYTITVDGNVSKYTVELDGETPKELIGDDVAEITVDSSAVTTLISNKKLGILPATGGDGIFFYVFVGAAIMALAVVLARRYRKDQSFKTGIA